MHGGKAARLHATGDSSRLQADHIGEVVVPLNATTIKRVCELRTRDQMAYPGTR